MKKKKENVIFGNEINTSPAVKIGNKTIEETEAFVKKLQEITEKKIYLDRDGGYVANTLAKAVEETHMTYQECLKYRMADRDDVVVMNPIRGEMERFEPKEIYRYVVPWIYPHVPEELNDGSDEYILACDITEGEWMMPLSEKRNCKALLPLYELSCVQGINRASREWIKEEMAKIYNNAMLVREADIHRHFFIKEDEVIQKHPELAPIKELFEKR